jgi:hypothetical protein
MGTAHTVNIQAQGANFVEDRRNYYQGMLNDLSFVYLWLTSCLTVTHNHYDSRQGTSNSLGRLPCSS